MTTFIRELHQSIWDKTSSRPFSQPFIFLISQTEVSLSCHLSSWLPHCASHRLEIALSVLVKMKDPMGSYANGLSCPFSCLLVFVSGWDLSLTTRGTLLSPFFLHDHSVLSLFPWCWWLQQLDTSVNIYVLLLCFLVFSSRGQGSPWKDEVL